MVRRRRRAWLAVLVVWASPSVGRADCPAISLDELLASAPLESAWRTRDLAIPLPEALYEKALERPGVLASRREGTLGQAVLVVDREVERLWMAINDDDHHAGEGYLPLEISRVVAGEAARSGRRTLQAFERFGVGRWWVIELEASRELYDLSQARLWELRWRDVMREYPAEPPLDIGVSVGRLGRTEGAWLLVRLAPSCTLIEYVATGEPGGFMSLIHWMVATRALRSTMEGMVALAGRHLDSGHDADAFVRPDGSGLGPPRTSEAAGVIR